MKTTDTISVNPGKSTLGHVNEEARNLFRKNIISGSTEHSAKWSPAEWLFPTTAAGVDEFKKYALPLRVLFATILIVSGLTVVEATTPGFSLGYGIAMMTAGGFLALGLLTRPVMAVSSVFLAIYGALALRSGNVQISDFSLMFGCLFFAATGSGKYSIDQFIKRGIHRISERKEKAVKDGKFTYKAFHIATKSL